MFGNGIPGRNKTRFLGKGIRGYGWYMNYKHTLAITQNNDIVQKRLNAILFFEKHGLSATIDAFGISKSSIYS